MGEMRGLDPRIHDEFQLEEPYNFVACCVASWIAGSGPAMTDERSVDKLQSPAARRCRSFRASHRPSASKPAPDITKTGTALKRSKTGALIATPKVCPR